MPSSFNFTGLPLNELFWHQCSSKNFAFVILRLRLKRKTQPAFRVLNAFYFQTDFNLRFKRKRYVRLIDAFYIAHYRSNGYAPLHRTLSLKWI